MSENNSENAKAKKKFKLDGFSTMFLAAILFIVGKETGAVGKEIGGVNPDTVISIICYVAAALIFLFAIRKVWNARKEQLIARIEAEELAAKQAAEAAEAEETASDSEDAEEAEDTDSDETE